MCLTPLPLSQDATLDYCKWKLARSTCRLLIAGMTVSNSTFTSLVQRYSHKDGKIYFDDYIHCIARLCTMFGEGLVLFINTFMC